MAKETQIYIEDEIKNSYLDYSMSVIVSRALPDVRDGLKPVHRRILFAMNEMGMFHEKPHKKSARIVGEVLGKYHPHGDTAVYLTMVRMAQDFNYRYMLIDGHGNFGSVDGDSAAAMRYTEARMSKITRELLLDIDKNTIDYRKNFDDSLDEPIVLPGKLPNLLLNGAAGIAVGMATNIPPHNLVELSDGIIATIDNRDIEDDELIKIVKGPDFPTGGIINGVSGIISAYKTGRGKVKVRGKVKIEEIRSGKEAIIINELPYQVNKARLIEKIANLVKEKKISGITDLRDESDRDGIRIVIELKKGEISELILNKLYKYTELQNTFGIIMLALVNNVPKVLTLKQILNHYLDHRYEVVVRRTKYELEKAEKRAHILEGFRKALDNISEIIKIIRGSKDAATAKESLIKIFEFTEIQAKSILDMRLQRLTGLERDKIETEYKELLKVIDELKFILGNDSKVFEIIKDEVIELRDKYGDKRRTEIRAAAEDILLEDLIKDEEVIVMMTNKGYIKRIGLDKYKAQNRGGKGVSSHNAASEDFVENMYLTKNLDSLLIFTNKGRALSLKVYEIPESSKKARGKLINNLINLTTNEKVKAVLKVREFEENKNIFFATKSGVVKKVSLNKFKKISKAGLIAINLKENDNLIYVGVANGDNDIFLATKQGYSIRFNESEIRSMGRTATGVKGINLRKNDEVVSGLVIENPEATVLTVTENGAGKRTKLKGYRLQSRGGKGLINMKINPKTGDVVEVKGVTDSDEIMLISSNGIVIRTAADTISTTGRSTQGVRVMKVDENEKVVSVIKRHKDKEIESDIESGEEE
ncbi:DNA gyrase subunit A [Haliovirga abyssi]|uniref:DNA gyrase subunit A n=1 Tax=Haliovirga abyssi TaxID=2996794 RepID=A0AAU9DMD3_9FUSO|nr:DNA gyrase subunit A [Haliovirga abyssi]BDU49438.1 DNA gyrase subunit A [Haliovirga abyssi]